MYVSMRIPFSILIFYFKTVHHHQPLQTQWFTPCPVYVVITCWIFADYICQRSRRPGKASLTGEGGVNVCLPICILRPSALDAAEKRKHITAYLFDCSLLCYVRIMWYFYWIYVFTFALYVPPVCTDLNLIPVISVPYSWLAQCLQEVDTPDSCCC